MTKAALSAAAAANDTYQQVAATAWPIRALIERGVHRPAEQAVMAALNIAPTIPNPVSRVDAVSECQQTRIFLRTKLSIACRPASTSAPPHDISLPASTSTHAHSSGVCLM